MSDRIRHAFEQVHAEEKLKQNTKDYIYAKLNKKSSSGFFAPYRMAAAIAVFAILIIGFGGYRLYTLPVFTISVDVNPSIELGVNMINRVVTVNAYNEDGAAVIQSINLKNKSYSEALRSLFDSAEMSSYLTDNSLVSITVSGKDAGKNTDIMETLAECKYNNAKNITCSSVDYETVAVAHEHGLSYGKYKAYLELSALDDTITPEDIQGLSMREIRDRIEALSVNDNSGNDSESIENDEHGQQNGAGQHNGSGQGQHDGSGQQNGYGQHDGSERQNGQGMHNSFGQPGGHGRGTDTL